MHLNPKHTKSAAIKGEVENMAREWEIIEIDEKKSKTKINSHSSENLDIINILAFLLSIYIGAAPCDQRWGKSHIHLSLFSCDIKTKISFRLLNVVIRRENRFDGSR